jgi:AcrR family transcriptional regulator
MPMQKALKTNRPPGSLKAKGLATRAALLDAAHEVFRDMGFYGSSVSEIARRCGVSMGTFYKYFKNKEQVFQELNDAIISAFTEQAAALDMEGLTYGQRLRRAIELLYRHTRKNLAFNRILGESELLDRVTVAHYDAIARFYRQFLRTEALAGNTRALDPDVIAYGLIGICYFHSLPWPDTAGDLPQERLIDLILDVVMNGVSGPASRKQAADASALALPEPAPLVNDGQAPRTRGEKTRQAIFKAAEKVIGEHGINRANIFEITREAGVAQGTFYVHFDSKQDLIEGFVKYYNHKMRREMQRVVSQTTDRRDAERVGALAFFEFTREHRKIYRIVPECEIISRQTSLWYYGKIAQGYTKGLMRGIERGQIRDLPAVFLARSLMGCIHFVALRWIIWNTGAHPNISEHSRADVIDFMLNGLNP